mmetsp:Transcript_4348/g.6616  ORF Transcript_4348/g.6616 Transcript_4348/m.6616 type:complete len:295 (-) Transcript_4348:1450-2334(-)|eukprot:CAMPEP_0197331334 /NCGR_PEP_ID=MMETSP0892-20130614/11135_1 /TAXON_ID=44058 ORGANISM="Aureoumbra lagunensis, Strain CCMP1510" /NCGR_SAMPLE_ID=MMETSP0892 /ASSEMBLY_ACC=CAM_ASM_000538 /LENGTH=294 /DNA_ID=CAMNT_0042829123 /DNA_START=6 /DNA_END=890 /DNA_ORIENTATION=+
MDQSIDSAGLMLEKELEARAEAVQRLNAALDNELPQMVSEADAMLDRRRRNDFHFNAQVEEAGLVSEGGSHPLEEIEDEIDPMAMARVRKLKARAAALEARREKADEEKDLIQRNEKAEAALAKAQAETQALRRELTQVKSRLDRETEAREAAENKASLNERELRSVERALRQAKKQVNNAGSETRTIDIRLSRALEETDKLKTALDAEKRSRREDSDTARQIREANEAHIRKLQHQKNELLAAFKKQLKLIDVLKRQKVHLEAARLLAFTEDDFMKVVSWGTPSEQQPQVTAS